MRAALLICILSLSAMAYAGPAFNKNINNQIEADRLQQNTNTNNQQYMTTDGKQTQTIETLKQWCFASQMSQPELTVSFKKLVNIVKSSPEDQSTEAAVMSERICQGATVPKSIQTGETTTATKDSADAQAHELIKDVYMDALIACESRECMKQLVKIVNSDKVDTIRASYYMTRIAVKETDSIKDESEIKQLVDSFITERQQSQSEAVERQKLFAVTAILGKSLKNEQLKHKQTELKQTAQQLVKHIVERYIKPVSQQEVAQYVQTKPEQQQQQLVQKIAKRSAAIKAIANIPGYVLHECQGVDEIITEIAQNKQELVTVRQSAIECLEENESAQKELKQMTFDQEEPIEVRIAAYRALMTSVYAGMKDESSKQQMAQQIIAELIKHCEDSRNQQQDDQFVLYVISHLDNVRTSQQPELEAVKEAISKNKQHYMQIQLLCKKFKQQLANVRKSSRNYKLEQEFNQIESGLVIEGDLIYESSKHAKAQQLLPKLIRVNMSMPVMGETVNVVEIAVRQNEMDEELMGALKLVQSVKFNSDTVNKVVDSFKSSVERASGKQQQQQTAEADLTIKVDGCTVVYLCLEDFKSASSGLAKSRSTRSIVGNSIVDEIIEHLKRKPVAFNRGFNVNINERIAKLLDVEANLIAGLRFDARSSGASSDDFEIVANIEPRVAFEAIVGPAKMSAKKLLQRVSTKSALGLRLRFKRDELVDAQIDLPMQTMELFTVESQLVEKSKSSPYSYNYLPNSIFGDEDIYSADEELVSGDEDTDGVFARKMKRSIFEKKPSAGKQLVKLMKGAKHQGVARSFETSDKLARATGLRGKLRFVASPKDMSLLVQALVQKYEPSMQGFRVQVQKVQRQADQKQYLVAISTPGSRLDRTMQVRVVKQTGAQRTSLKASVQAPKMSYALVCELVHDGHHYAVKSELVASRNQQQWRHLVEAGVQRGSQAQSGRIAATFKPYLNIESSALKRPIQMQGVVSYQQTPKTVISYELKCPTWGDFLQGKLILDERQAAYANKRAAMPSVRRSMRSPMEFVLAQDLTLTVESVAQLGEHSMKLHKMVDWDAGKWALSADVQLAHNNLRKRQLDTQFNGQLKLNTEQQMLVVARKCPAQARRDFRLTLASELKAAGQHQLVAEWRFTGKRAASNLDSMLAYKHKIDYNQIAADKLDLGLQLELVDSERAVAEKFQGRAQLAMQRKLKALKCELESRNKRAKLDAEFVALDQHRVELVVSEAGRFEHRTAIRAVPSEVQFESRTLKDQEELVKLFAECDKRAHTLKLAVEVPCKSVRVAADVKLVPGQLSSIAVQSARYSSKGQFSFDTVARSLGSWAPLKQFRIKTDLKDTMKQENYWLESAFEPVSTGSAFLRFDSPLYRTDLEFDARDLTTKVGMFKRAKRSTNGALYSLDESILAQIADKLALNANSNKLWMLRSVIAPNKMDELKQKVRRAIFEFADRRQSHKHQINWEPVDERVNFHMERVPSAHFRTELAPMRLTGDLSTRFWGAERQEMRPSSLAMESEWLDVDVNAKPFDGEQAFVKLGAVSRHRRSPFAKHESELRFHKDQGYKAWMKHEDQKQRRHQWQLEADESPRKWAKMSFESDKHGKAEYEHQWRKHQAKHQQAKRTTELADDSVVYANKVSLRAQSPDERAWSHATKLEWEEPVGKQMMAAGSQRLRRDLSARYGALDYLKHVNARLESQHLANQAELYKVNFDYAPESHARLAVNMPGELLHTSSLEYQPAERTYKLHSKLASRMGQQPAYELVAATKPVAGLATADQEPVFVDFEHPMLERPVSDRLAASLFKQPIKLDYSDKYGRLARFDYDLSPADAALAKLAGSGLRQKRAAFYYKDDAMDFEHDSTLDFYPETLLGKLAAKKHAASPAALSMSTNTKLGPVSLRAEQTGDQSLVCELQSPVVRAKLTAETAKRTQLIKLELDNKKQQAQLARLVRRLPLLRDSELVQKLAKKLDQARFEHQTELLVSIVDCIFKLKSQTHMNQSPLMTVEGELNKQQEKLVVKIDGKRTDGQLVVDLVHKAAQLAFSVDQGRTVKHVSRVQRVADNFYSLDSLTSHHSEPILKLTGKISAMILEEPAHLFAKRRSSAMLDAHVSTFQATLFQPEQVQIQADYDCLKKEARIVFENMRTKKTQETRVRFDDNTQDVLVEARLASPFEGQLYSAQAKLNVPSMIDSRFCARRGSQSCQSQLVYKQKSGHFYSAKLIPGELIVVDTPHGKQSFNLNY